MRIGFLASHSGSNLQAIIDACKSGALQASPVVVISNNGGSGALLRAQTEGISHYHLSGKTHPDPEDLDRAILNVMRKHSVDIMVLAGYMKKLGPRTLQEFSGHILNIHPALLPKFGGKGMHGMRVHEAVIASGETESGCSIHLVDEEYDTGPVVAQARVSVEPADTAETLAARVLDQEHLLLPETLRKIITGEILLPDMKGRVLLFSEKDVGWLPLHNEVAFYKDSNLPPQGLITSVHAMAFSGDKFLFTRHPVRDWDIPGGHIEKDETPEKALEREVFEETGARLTSIRVFGYFKITLNVPDPTPLNYPYPESYIQLFIGRVDDLDSFTPKFETLDRKLFSPEEAEKLLWVKRFRKIFHEAFKVHMEAGE